MRLTLPKKTKLCSQTAIVKLFDRTASRCMVSYPLRAVWRVDSQRKHGDSVQFMITVPKKKIRHAVDRVKLRRRIREAYRLNYRDFLTTSSGQLPDTPKIDIAFIYLSDTIQPYSVIEESVKRILSRSLTRKDHSND